MMKVEGFDSQVADLRKNNLGGVHNGQISSRANWKWDIQDQLTPVNDEIDQLYKAIYFKMVK